MSEVVLIVNGIAYGGWKSIRITRSIESICGSFTLDVSDRWGGQNVPWPILEEDACRVEIDGQVVLDGYVDKRSFRLSATSRGLSYQGRDRASAIVDSSAGLGTGKKWSFAGADIAKVAKELCAEHGVALTVQAGLKLTPQGKCVLNPGDTAYHALHRMATAAGVLLVSDGKGGVLITRAGTEKVGTALAEGDNVLEAAIDYDATERFSRYVLKTQTGGGGPLSPVNGVTSTDDGATVTKKLAVISAISAEATDLGVRRKDRVLMIRPEGGMDAKLAKQRADWEARVRAARAEKVSITTPGWRQRGQLWPLNMLVEVHVPSIGIDGELLISQVEHTISNQGGEITQLQLVRPDAFLPEPRAVVKAESGALAPINPVKP